MSAADKSANADAIKRLYRSASELVKTLDKAARSASTLEEVCVLKVINLRTRLREICERLMFLDPLGHGKKAEDLLWRKVYYELVLLAKNVRKSPACWSENDQHRLANHISMGIGAYHHLLFRLQSEFQLSGVEGCADFLLLNYTRGTAKGKNSFSAIKLAEEEKISEWATQAFQRCLICMGDLARYQQELGVSSTAFASTRYYRQALLVSTKSSMPHNQLGTLAGTVNHNLDAAYNYMRCVIGNNGFEGANGNLNRIFDRNQQSLLECSDDVYQKGGESMNREIVVKRFIVHFLRYCKICFDYPDIDSNLSMENICEVVLQEFQKCLELNLYGMDENNSVEEHVGNPPLSKELIFKFFIMNLMCIEKLENKGESDASAAIALTLATLSHLLHHILAIFRRRFSRSAGNLNDLLSGKVELPDDELGGNIEISNAILSKTEKRARKSHLRCRRKLRASFCLDDDSDDAASLCGGNAKRSSCGDVTESDEDEETATDKDEEEDDDDDDSDGSSELSANKSNRNTPTNRTANGHVLLGETSPDATNIKSNLPVSSEKLMANSIEMPEVNGEIGDFLRDFDDAAAVVEFVIRDSLLTVVKVCVDWLKGHPLLIDATARGSLKFCSRFVDLLNMMIKLADILSKDSSDCSLERFTSNVCQDFKQKWPLPEDVCLSGLVLVAKAHEDIDFSLRISTWLTAKDEVLLRMASIRHLGFLMTECDGSGVSYDADQKKFVSAPSTSVNLNGSTTITATTTTTTKRKGKNSAKNGGEKKVHDRKKHLMHNMAQLWLEAEVKELESALKSPGKIAFPPYLVPDCSVLIDHLPLIRQLMGSKVFIFILPIAVLQSLDDMKKESSKAREVIRWLEGEFKKRNRYLRAQKRHERLVLSILKYPKRKYKDAWNMFAVLECCNYFAHQGSASNESSPNLVTCLTAGSSKTSTSEKGGHSLFAVASSMGLNVESVENLHTRWMKSSHKPAKNKLDKQ